MSAGSLRRRQITPSQVFHGHLRESAVGEEKREDGGELMFPASVPGKAAKEWEQQDRIQDRWRRGRASGSSTQWSRWGTFEIVDKTPIARNGERDSGSFKTAGQIAAQVTCEDSLLIDQSS